MNSIRLLELSIKYSPPKINLRDAEILDSYGSEGHAKLPIDHKHPDDVSKKEFDYYGWIYPFMNFEDLLFYFYPLAREYEKDRSLDCIDSFLYSFDRHWKIQKKNVNTEDRMAIIEGLQWMWDVGGNDYADFEQCPNLIAEINTNN